MKKNILIMVNHMGIGGVEKTLLSLLSAMDEKKYNIDLLLINESGKLIDFIPKYVNIIKLEFPHDIYDQIFFGRKFAIIQDLKKGYFIKAMLKCISGIKYLFIKQNKKRLYEFSDIYSKIPKHEKKYDLAVDYMGYMSFSTFYIAEKVEAGVKATWLHSELKRSKTDPRIFRKYYNKYNNIFGVSKKCVNEFVEYFPEFKDKTSVFYNIISSELIKSMAKQGASFSDSYNGIRLLTVGRLSKEKGYDIAIQVLARLLEDGYNLKWYVLGEGKEFDNLVKLIKIYKIEDNFILLGSDPNPYKYMTDCDIYVQTSIYEGYSTTTNEARILCKPIITTDVSGAQEQFINNHNGLIVKCDVEEIYNAIVKLIKDKSLCTMLSNNLSKYSIDTTLEIEKLYKIIS